MAPRPVKNKRKTAAFYAKNPEARKKKAEYDKEYHSSLKRKKYRAELSRERRSRKIDGKGGGDLSHMTGGGFKRENPSTNRARNGHGNNKRLAPKANVRKRPSHR